MSTLEDTLLAQIRAAKLPDPERESRFHPVRRWRFDFAWPGLLLACEVEGGTWIAGRHARGAGIEGDCEKYGWALVLGWRVLRVTGKQVKSGQALEWLELLIDNARHDDVR